MKTKISTGADFEAAFPSDGMGNLDSQPPRIPLKKSNVPQKATTPLEKFLSAKPEKRSAPEDNADIFALKNGGVGVKKGEGKRAEAEISSVEQFLLARPGGGGTSKRAEAPGRNL